MSSGLPGHPVVNWDLPTSMSGSISPFYTANPTLYPPTLLSLILDPSAGFVIPLYNQQLISQPVSVVHFPPGPNPYSSDLPKYFIPPPRQRRFLPSFIPVHRPLPRLAYEPDQTPANIPRSGPNWQVPPVGEEVTVGVLIALPFEEEVDDLWIGKEDGEGEVPQVCLGVVAVRID